MISATEKGHAKINLHLDITGRTPDGFHTVETVMQSISLCDTVTVTLREDSEFHVTCNVSGVPTDSKNLAVRAAMLFCEYTGADKGANIDIDKQIPMAAGMAGGSADAAAVLRAMNALSDAPLSLSELCDIGSRLGADVPFCIVEGSAYADGKGDVLHPFADMPDCFILAACGGEGVSTPWAYGTLDARYGGFLEDSSYSPRGTEALADAINQHDLCAVARTMYNVFEQPILECRPIASLIKQTMLDGGALGAMMSGSGPSVFGIFDSEVAARRSADQIKKLGYFAEVCRPLKK